MTFLFTTVKINSHATRDVVTIFLECDFISCRMLTYGVGSMVQGLRKGRMCPQSMGGRTEKAIKTRSTLLTLESRDVFR